MELKSDILLFHIDTARADEAEEVVVYRMVPAPPRAAGERLGLFRQELGSPADG